MSDGEELCLQFENVDSAAPSGSVLDHSLARCCAILPKQAQSAACRQKRRTFPKFNSSCAGPIRFLDFFSFSHFGDLEPGSRPKCPVSAFVSKNLPRRTQRSARKRRGSRAATSPKLRHFPQFSTAPKEQSLRGALICWLRLTRFLAVLRSRLRPRAAADGVVGGSRFFEDSGDPDNHGGQQCDIHGQPLWRILAIGYRPFRLSGESNRQKEDGKRDQNLDSDERLAVQLVSLGAAGASPPDNCKTR